MSAQEYLVVCEGPDKPLVLFNILQRITASEAPQETSSTQEKSRKRKRGASEVETAPSAQCRRVLCFTSSLEATHRLALLLKMMGFDGVEEFSSSLSQTRRSALLNRFKQNQVRMYQ